ncbi:MAG: hypothetical protein U0270_33490 [Labilithrix sp.]
MTRAGRWGAGLAFAAVVAACSSSTEPSKGTYTIAFPSTAAAVATDFVQILVFDVNGDRATLCQDLVTTRLNTPEDLVPSVNPPAEPTNICELRAGVKPIDVPYGEHALLAIGQRKQGDSGGTKDFLIGCAIMTVGEGDAPVSIPVRLVNVNQPVPPTKCGSVQEFCEKTCSAS